MPVVENYGEAVYAGLFLNMIIRCSQEVAIANTTALLHGGCVHKAGGQVFVDPQYLVLREYARLIGGQALETKVQAPTFMVETSTDLGLPLNDLPYLDAVTVRLPDGQRIVCAVNCHAEQTLNVQIYGGPDSAVRASYLGHDGEVTDRARLGDDSQRFAMKPLRVERVEDMLNIQLPPASVTWITFAA